MSLFDSNDAKSRIVMFPSKRNGSSVGAEDASTMVGRVSELRLGEGDAARWQSSHSGPVTVQVLAILYPLEE